MAATDAPPPLPPPRASGGATGFSPHGGIPAGTEVPTNDPPVNGGISVLSWTLNADGTKTYKYSDGSRFVAAADGGSGTLYDAKGASKPIQGGYLVSRKVDENGYIVSIMSDGTIDKTNLKTGHVQDTDPSGKVINDTYRPDSGIHPGSGTTDYLNNFLESGPAGVYTKTMDKAAGGPLGKTANKYLNDLTDGAFGGDEADGDLSVDTKGVQGDIDSARALREQFNAAYLAAHPGEAPKIDPTTLSPQERATASGLADAVGGSAGHATASLASAAPDAATFAGTAGHATTERALASLLDPTQQAEWRTKQGGLADYLNGVIAGKTPSVAQLQLKDQTQLNSANQLGLASKMSGGGNAFLALQNAAGNIGRLNADEASKGAILRATEEEKARAQLAALIDQARGSDITLADRNATLSTDVSKTNATNTTSTNNANAGRDTDVSLADAAARNAAELARQREANEIARANALNSTNISNSNAGRDTDVSLAKALADNAAALQHERELNSVSRTNADNSTTLTAKQGDITSGERKADASNIITQRDLDEKAKKDAADAALSASGQTITGGGNLVDSLAKIKAAQAKAATDRTGQAGSALAWALG